MYHVPCTMYYVLCTMHYALCTMYYVLCTMYYILRIIYYEPCAMYYVPWTKLPTTFGKLTRFMFSCLFQEAGHIGADRLLHSENDQVRSLKTLVCCYCGSRYCRKKDETNRTTVIELLSKRTIRSPRKFWTILRLTFATENTSQLHCERQMCTKKPYNIAALKT